MKGKMGKSGGKSKMVMRNGLEVTTFKKKPMKYGRKKKSTKSTKRAGY